MSPHASAPTLIPVEVDGGQGGVRTIVEVLGKTQSGDGYALLPAYAGPEVLRRLRTQLSSRHRHSSRQRVEGAVCCPTSGSTGTPRLVVLPRVLLTEVALTRDKEMGGPAAWFVGVPPATAGGLVAIARGLRSPVPPTAWTGAGVARFDVDRFTAEAGAFLDEAAGAGVHARVSLVATQVHRLLSDATATEVLARFHTVLIGGGPLAESTRKAAKSTGVTVVHSYGATETCGGCVYDGVPVAGTSVRIRNDEIQISGDCLASDYVDGPLRRTEDGWWQSGDRGAIVDGKLHVWGRFDDVVTVNGANVDLAVVRRTVDAIPGVSDAVVLTVPDPAGGVRLRAFVVGDVSPDEVRATVGDRLGSAAVPRVTQMTRLPLLASGKVDVERLREEV